MPQLVTFHLDQLRTITETDTQGGSEPYLWVTYFYVDGRNLFQPEPVKTDTPFYDAFREEFPDNVTDGQVIQVPVFIANSSAEIDPGPQNFMMAGCVVALLEEDETPGDAIRAGRNAFMETLHQKLNELIKERIATMNREPVTEDEKEDIRNAVNSKVKSAIKEHLSLWEEVTLEQDDMIGFNYVVFIGDEIQTRDFQFRLGKIQSDNNFILSGSLTVGPVKPDPVDPCALQRSNVQGRVNKIKGLQARVTLLQEQLQNAGAPAKPAIVDQIKQLNSEISKVEEELKVWETQLKICENGVLGG